MTDPAIRDEPEHWETLSKEEKFRGHIFSVRADRVIMQDGEIAGRDVAEHPGAVAVLALDEADRALMIRQYRHPVGMYLWELPAGLRDVDGEPPLTTAERELGEETGYRAGEWLTLADYFSSPGMSTERVRIFLARGVTEIPPAERTFTARHEEASMQVAWVPIDDAVSGVLAGHVHSATAVVGILAAYAARSDRFATLRSAGAPEG